MKKPRKSRKGLTIFGIVVLMLFGSWGIINIIPRFKYPGDNPWIIQEGERPMVIAHRGGKDWLPPGGGAKRRVGRYHRAFLIRLSSRRYAFADRLHPETE